MARPAAPRTKRAPAKASATSDPEPAAPQKTSRRSKRAIIMRTAVKHFGTDGYDETKWAEVAIEVGLGGTALYHYFESKQHCLFEIMADALASYREAFAAATGAHDEYLPGLRAALRSGFALDDYEILRMRVLVDKQGSIGGKSSTPREEESRLRARNNIRGLEMDWAAYLARGVAGGLIPNNDMRLLARAVLAMNTSVWQWYRPDGAIPLSEVADFYVGKQLAIIGID
ncbi:TetR/AcrR family transcriptional regulator [Pseudonocardia ailaonensis]|uniref:TetR/AcrR family transcriptional regulator n=1 Tax=Pseudonocardia ailaonensis TaxID=367279 RepID=A0ABN2MYV7_9PSEU